MYLNVMIKSGNCIGSGGWINKIEMAGFFIRGLTSADF